MYPLTFSEKQQCFQVRHKNIANENVIVHSIVYFSLIIVNNHWVLAESPRRRKQFDDDSFEAFKFI